MAQYKYVVERLAQAALDPSLWGSGALVEISRHFGASGAALIPVKARVPFFPTTPSIEAMARQYFTEEWFKHDQRERGLSVMRSRGLFVDQDFASPDEIKKTAFYQDFAGRHQATWSVGLRLLVGSDEWVLVLYRSEKQGSFETSEYRSLLQMAAEARQTATLSHHLSYGRALGLNDAFDMIGCASILLDRSGRVFRTNTKAQAYIPDRLIITRNRIVSHRFGETAEIERLVHDLLFNTADANVKPPSVIISSPMAPPVIIQGVGLSGILSDAFSDARVLLFIIDPFSERASAPIDELKKFFHLTQKEAELVWHLGQDRPLTEAAERLGVSYETVRTQLKGVFARTNTKKQSEIISLLARLSFRVNGDG